MALISFIISQLEENMTHPFIVSNKTIIKKNDIVISTFAEPLRPGTKYKAMGVLEAGNKTFYGAWTNFTTECTGKHYFIFIQLKYYLSQNLILQIITPRVTSCQFQYYGYK